MKVVFINPPYYFLSGLEYLPQNLGLGYLSGVLLRDGHDVEIIDALAEGMEESKRIFVAGRWLTRVGLSYEAIVNRIPPNADVVGITAPFSNHATIIDELTKAIKERGFGGKLIVGGVYPSAQPERALKSYADMIIVGEGEEAMRALLRGVHPSKIPGIWFKNENKIVKGGMANVISDLDAIPFPARELFPMSKYFALSPRSRFGIPTAAMITSRGCPFDCSFCSIHPVNSRKWRARSAENVLEEIDELTNKWGVKFIEFEDDNLTLNKERAVRIFEGLASRDVRWSCANGLRVDTLDYETLELMKKAGCEAIHLAIESGAPEMLERMNKKLDLGRVKEIARACKKLDLPIVAFFIVGHPGESEKSFKKSLNLVRWLKNFGMTACGVHIATPYPGTRLLEICREKGYLLNDNIEEKILFPGDIHIETEDFSRKDILSRVYRMRVVAGILPAQPGGIRRFIEWKVKPFLSRLKICKRKYIAEFYSQKLNGFYEAEKWFDGITYRWSMGDASVKISLGKKNNRLRLFMKSNRRHTVEVYIEEKKVGEVNLDDVWRIFELPLPHDISIGESELVFKSDAVSPFELGYNEIRRVQGFILSWFEFLN